LGAAQGKVNVYELEYQQELNMVDFTDELRFLYDNSSPESAGQAAGTSVDVVSHLRSLMSAHGFDSGRVVYSGFVSDSTSATWNCTNIYTDYSRQFSLDSIASAYGGGWIGRNGDAVPNQGLWCGGTDMGSMYQVPFYEGQPDMLDSHMYPSVVGTGTGDTQIEQVAALDFSDLAHLVALLNFQSDVIMIGETHNGSQYDGTMYDGTSCALNPNSAAESTVQGFNQSQLAGQTIVFRPWMELADPSGECYPYPDYQNVNYDWGGPYTPNLW
jgi:hypothetical protein